MTCRKCGFLSSLIISVVISLGGMADDRPDPVTIAVSTNQLKDRFTVTVKNEWKDPLYVMSLKVFCDPTSGTYNQTKLKPVIYPGDKEIASFLCSRATKKDPLLLVEYEYREGQPAAIMKLLEENLNAKTSPISVSVDIQGVEEGRDGKINVTLQNNTREMLDVSFKAILPEHVWSNKTSIETKLAPNEQKKITDQLGVRRVLARTVMPVALAIRSSMPNGVNSNAVYLNRFTVDSLSSCSATIGLIIAGGLVLLGLFSLLSDLRNKKPQ